MSISFFDDLGVLFCILVNFCCLDHLVDHQKLNIIYKNEYFILWWLRGPFVTFQLTLMLGLLGRSPEVERHLKMSISFFWLERGGGWGSGPLTSPAHHQKLNVIQEWAFHFLAGEGWWMGLESMKQPSQSSEVEHNPRMSISLFGWRGVVDGVRVHEAAQPIIRSWT